MARKILVVLIVEFIEKLIFLAPARGDPSVEAFCVTVDNFCLGSRVQGSGFRVQALGFRLQGLGFLLYALWFMKHLDKFGQTNPRGAGGPGAGGPGAAAGTRPARAARVFNRLVIWGSMDLPLSCHWGETCHRGQHAPSPCLVIGGRTPISEDFDVEQS